MNSSLMKNPAWQTALADAVMNSFRVSSGAVDPPEPVHETRTQRLLQTEVPRPLSPIMGGLWGEFASPKACRPRRVSSFRHVRKRTDGHHGGIA
jgi:hypothetical protein